MTPQEAQTRLRIIADDLRAMADEVDEIADRKRLIASHKLSKVRFFQQRVSLVWYRLTQLKEAL